MAGIGEFDIMEWIAKGTVARRTVVIYNDPGVVAEFEELERRLAAAERTAKKTAGEESVGDRDEVTEILEQMQALHDRWEASKSTWTVRALSDEEIRDLDAMHPLPTRPEDPADNADDAEKAEHAAAIQQWATAHQAARDARNFAYISTAVESVKTAQGEIHTVPVEAIAAMRARPHGALRTEQLLRAVSAATVGDVEVPAPKSPAPSRTDRA